MGIRLLSPERGSGGESHRRNVMLMGGSLADRDVIARLLSEAGSDAYDLDWVQSESAIVWGLGGTQVILWRLGEGARLAEFVEWVDAAEHTAPVVAVMDPGEDDIAAIRCGATDAVIFDHLDAGTLSRSIRYSVERHRLITELERERQLLHALLDTLPSAIYFKDAESRFLRISRKLANDFNLAHPSQVIGKTDSDFFAEEHATTAFRDEQALVGGEVDVIRKEEREVWADGRVTWAATSKLPLRDRMGRIVGTFGMSLDVTDKKAAESLLRSDKEAAEDASRAKSDFVANISHEIRTPMNAILGMTDLVLETDLDATQRDYLEMVRESAEALMVIVDDVLDFSKIEAGKMDLSPTTVDIRALCAQTLSPLSVRADRKGIELVVDVHESVPSLLVVDSVRLRQVIANLVVNAVKFTDTGSVTFSLALAAESDEEVVVRFAVRDTGIGIRRAK
ncbi:MAG: histidine kinase dimerization/phospho-acceptor domain-containing protein, partial [Acidimicrobiia bacterium]